ncbi:MAG: potassium channel family protein [Patescibacteria group bacterium]|jgi:hypothetical protein|nr:potassium channel family protein [Patescibacteria group bacterium]
MDNSSKEQLAKELKSQLNNFRILAVSIISMIIVSALFFHKTEKWNMLDSFYYVVVTLGTVGYGDFTPKTNAGKIYAMALIVVGIALFGFFAQQLIKRQQLRNLERQLKKKR